MNYWAVKKVPFESTHIYIDSIRSDHQTCMHVDDHLCS